MHLKRRAGAGINNDQYDGELAQWDTVKDHRWDLRKTGKYSMISPETGRVMPRDCSCNRPSPDQYDVDCNTCDASMNDLLGVLWERIPDSI